MTAIETRNLRKDYRTRNSVRTVLGGISLVVNRGEMVAITGPSGCGKSTLLSVLGLLQPPTSGDVSIEGTDCTRLSASSRARIRREHIGFVFQDFALLGHFTLSENIGLPLVYDGLCRAAIDQRVSSAMSMLGIASLSHQYPAQVSGGEKQRAALARALVRAPGIILADEPTGNLDASNAQFVFDCFREVARAERTTVVVVTHDQRMAGQADRVIELAACKDTSLPGAADRRSRGAGCAAQVDCASRRALHCENSSGEAQTVFEHGDRV